MMLQLFSALQPQAGVQIGFEFCCTCMPKTYILLGSHMLLVQDKPLELQVMLTMQLPIQCPWIAIHQMTQTNQQMIEYTYQRAAILD